MLQKRHNAAIVIEKHARGFVAKKGYKRLRENVIRMQSFYPRMKSGVEANVKYNFAMVIQASARGWQVRRAVRACRKNDIAVFEMLSGVFRPQKRRGDERGEEEGSRTRRDGEARKRKSGNG